MYLAYKAIKKHRQEKKNAAQFQTPGNESLDEYPLSQYTPDENGQGPSRTEVGTEQTSHRTDWKYMLILTVALVLPVFLETLDYTIVATSATIIASHFNSLNMQSYIGSIYLLTSTVFLLPFASVADTYGRHFALQLALVLFLIGSAISTGGQNMPMLLAGRAIAGAGGAGLLALVRIITADTGSLDQNNLQTTMLFFMYTVGYCVGPFIGGALVGINFRWIFGINLPVSAVAIVIAFLLLRKRVKGSESSRSRFNSTGHDETALDRLFRIDWLGIWLLAPAGILIILALGWGSSEEWNTTKVIVCFAVGGALFIAFLAWEYILERQQRSSRLPNMRILRTDPLLPLVVFRTLDISILMFCMFVSGMVMLVMFYFIAIFMTLIAGYSPTKSGAQLVYFAPGMGAGSIISIISIKHTRQPRYAIILGGLVLSVALGMTSMAARNNNLTQLNGFLVMAGAGVGLSMGSSAIQARFKQPPERLAVISSLGLAFRALGGTIGIAQCATVLNAKVRSSLTNAILSGDIPQSAISSLTGSGVDSLDTLNSLPTAVQQIVKDAFQNGLRWAFISLIPWAAVAFLLSLFLRNISDGDEHLRSEQPENKELRNAKETRRERV